MKSQLLINKAAVKKFALEVAKTRYHKFTRVSKEFLINADGALRALIRQDITTRPSKGKTL